MAIQTNLERICGFNSFKDSDCKQAFFQMNTSHYQDSYLCLNEVQTNYNYAYEGKFECNF